MEKDSSKAASPGATARAASTRRELTPKPRSASAARPAPTRASSRAGAVGRDVKGDAKAGEPRGDKQGGAKKGGAQIEEGQARPRTRLRQPDEPRAQMLERLSNPLISLHEASVLLQVCAATVRRLSNEGELPHKRTEGGQRRFHLSDVLRLSDERERRRASSNRASARSLARPSSPPAAPPPTAASARRREQERLEEVRAEQARVREGRERLAAMHARAQEARLAAQKQPGSSPVPTSTPGPTPVPAPPARSVNPLRLGLARALAPRAAEETSKPKPHEGDE